VTTVSRATHTVVVSVVMSCNGLNFISALPSLAVASMSVSDNKTRTENRPCRNARGSGENQTERGALRMTGVTGNARGNGLLSAATSAGRRMATSGAPAPRAFQRISGGGVPTARSRAHQDADDFFLSGPLVKRTQCLFLTTRRGWIVVAGAVYFDKGAFARPRERTMRALALRGNDVETT
jgi:hypothetical protein